jgi:hypothetical protein
VRRLGFALEEFWTDEPGMTDRRLENIILARGITDVLLSPVLTPETSLTLDWDWSCIAAVVIDDRAKHAWTAAFLAHHPTPTCARGAAALGERGAVAWIRPLAAAERRRRTDRECRGEVKIPAHFN